MVLLSNVDCDETEGLMELGESFLPTAIPG